MALGELSRLRDAKGDPDLGGRYADTGGLRPVCRLTRGADQRKDQPPHSLRRPRDDRMVEHRGRRPCRAAQSPKWADRVESRAAWSYGSAANSEFAGDVVVIPGGTEHEAWFREDTEVIDFFAPPRDDFLLGGKPAYMSEG